MQIKIKNVLGKAFTVDVEVGEKPPTLEDLKQAIQDREGIPPKQQRLAILLDSEINTLPYGDNKINKVANEFEQHDRFLRGLDTPLEVLKVGPQTTLLLVLRLTDEDDEANLSVPDKLQSLYREVVFKDLKLSQAQITDIAQHIKTFDKNTELVSPVANLLSNAYSSNVDAIVKVDGVVESTVEMFSHVTDKTARLDMLEILDGAAGSNIDGIIVKIISLGVLDIAKKLLEENDATPGTLTREQQKVIRFLETLIRNHEPAATQIAAIIYRDNFVNKNQFIQYRLSEMSPEYYMWDEAKAVFKTLDTSTADFKIQLIEVKGYGLAAKDKNGKSDPYFVCGVAPDYKEKVKNCLKSSVIKEELNPVWNMSKEKQREFLVPHDKNAFLNLYDQDMIGSDFMGSFCFRPAFLYAMQEAHKKKEFVFSCELEMFEVGKKDIKFVDVSGYMTLKMVITRNSS